MKPGIHLSVVVSDDDFVELCVRVADGASSLSNHVYAGREEPEEAVSRLRVFKNELDGGLLDLQFGKFGPEYAGGAFHARFHFAYPGRLFATCQQEFRFTEFARKEVASTATLYVMSEPALLDRQAKRHTLRECDCQPQRPG